MSKPKSKSKRKARALEEAEADDDVVRSIRFPRKVDDAIAERAAKLGLKHSTFVKQAAAVAVGMGDVQVKKIKELVEALESLE